MKRIALAVALLTVSLLLLNAGCYTVLKHPTGSSVVQEGTNYRSCSDCHADAAYYHPYGHPYYSYGSSHYGWGSYYGAPWWYDDYWWWDPGYDHEPPRVETGTRHLWSSGGWAPGGWGFSKSGSGTRRPPPPATPPVKKDNKNDDKKKDEQKEKEEGERHLWTKPKKGF